MKLAEIWCYPVKSCAGVAASSAGIGARGIHFDRRWMLVDEGGCFLSQRQLPRLAQVRPAFGKDTLVLQVPDRPPLEIPLAEGQAAAVEVQIWRDRCTAAAVGREADRWFSEFLAREVRLVYLPDVSRRAVAPDYARPSDEVGFADGYPFMLLGRASLHDLGARMGSVLSVRRFRPNLVVEGAAAYAEDDWRRIRIGGVTFRVVKPCSRCVITTLDPETGERDLNTLAALAEYRRRDNKVYFGQNLIHDADGELRVGQPVEVIEGA